MPETSNADTDAEDAQTETATDADTEAEPDAEADTESETAPETETETEAAGDEADTDTEGEPSGADPDGTTDVATDETETVAANEQSSGFSAIIEAGTIQNAINSVSVLVDECKIRLNENEFAIRAVDPANVGMVDLSLAAAAFESYQGNGGVIGVNLDRLEDIIGMANSGDLIFLDLDEETRKLHIECEGLSYTLALIDPDSIRQEPDIPDLDLGAEIVVEGSQLDRGITAADMVSDHIALSVDPDAETFHIQAEGDTDDVDLELERDDLIDLAPAEADSLYSLDYLKDMNKAIPKTGEVTAELGEEFPVKLHYEVEDSAGLGKVTYMLAPRIQSD